MLAQFGETGAPAIRLATCASTICAATQEKDGSWFGRWGMNYIYGTWSALWRSTPRASIRRRRNVARRATGSSRIQNADGGWGEDGASYKLDYRGYERAPARLADRLGAAGADGGGRHDHPAVARGIAWLRRRKATDGVWRGSATPRPVSRGCFICAITAIRNFSRCGRWRAIAICAAAIRGLSPTECRARLRDLAIRCRNPHWPIRLFVNRDAQANVDIPAAIIRRVVPCARGAFKSLKLRAKLRLPALCLAYNTLKKSTAADQYCIAVLHIAPR